MSIVTSAAPLWPAGKGLAVGDSATLDLTAFNQPASALRLSDGRIVVADGRPVLLKYFGRDGRPLYDVGGAEDGAGRLQSIYQLDLAGADTVAVYDFSRRRLLLIDPNGGLAATVSVADSLTGAGFNGYLPKGVAPDGRYLLQRDEVSFPFSGAPGSILADSTRLFWLSRQGTLTDSSGRMLAGELFGFVVRMGVSERVVTPLARPLAPALRVVTGRDFVWTGDGRAWELLALDRSGHPARLLRLPLERTVLTPAMRDSFIASYRARVAGQPATSLPRQLAEEMPSAPFPDRLPAYSELLAGEDSTLWVQHFGLLEGRAGDPGLVWTVFGADGRWLGEVAMPPQFRPTAVGHDWILGLARDDAGRTHVRLYPLVER